MLTKGAEYVAQGLEDDERQFHEKMKRSLQRRAFELGFHLAPAKCA